MKNPQESPLQKIGNQDVLLGWKWNLDEAKIAARKKDALRLEKNSARIRETYGDLSDADVLQVVYAEEENSACKNCEGLPCRKKTNQNYIKIPRLNEFFGTINVAVSPCKFIRAYWKRNKTAQMFQAAGIPLRYEGLTFNDYKVDANNAYAVEMAHALLKHTDKGAFFFGSYGSGKTMLAAIIAQEHLKLGREVLFIKLPDLLANIRKTFSSENKVSEIDVLEKLYKVDVLILDDISATRQNKFAGETLFKIVDARYNANLQTIMTSNNRLKELEEALNNPRDSEPCYDGSRIYDRCKQMCTPVELKGGSRR